MKGKVLEYFLIRKTIAIAIVFAMVLSPFITSISIIEALTVETVESSEVIDESYQVLDIVDEPSTIHYTPNEDETEEVTDEYDIIEDELDQSISIASITEEITTKSEVINDSDDFSVIEPMDTVVVVDALVNDMTTLLAAINLAPTTSPGNEEAFIIGIENDINISASPVIIPTGANILLTTYSNSEAINSLTVNSSIRHIRNNGALALKNIIISGFDNGVDITNVGGGIYNSSGATLNINDTAIIEKILWHSAAGLAAGESAAVYNYGTVNVYNGAIIRNNRGIHASAIGNRGILNISGGEIFNNSNVTRVGDSFGGAIQNFSGTITMTGGQIRNNKSRSLGGAIVFTGDNDIFNFIDGEIKYNEAPYGGGIAVYGWNSGYGRDITLNLKGGTISDNKSTGNGGGIFVHEYYTIRISINLSGTEISNNVAGGGGGGMFLHTGSHLTMTGGSVVGNTSSNFAGGISITGDSDSTTHVDHSKLTITGGVISGNTGVFGGVWVNRGVTFSMTGGTIKENIATNNGGGISISPNNTPTTTANITGGTITGNKAPRGAGLYIAGINASTPITLNASNLTISNNLTTSHATYTTDGAGIYVGANATLNLSDSTINNNTALNYGGGIYVASGRSATLTNVLLNNNTAIRGGGVYGNDATLNIYGSKLDGNIANLGGGLYINNSTVTMTNVTLKDNQANLGGGIYVNTGSILDIISGKIESNSAVNGGGLFVARNLNAQQLPVQNVSIDNVMFDGNKALDVTLNIGDGGAIYVENHLNLKTTNNVVFTNNQASRLSVAPTDYCDTNNLFSHIQFTRTPACPTSRLLRSSINNRHVLNNYDINWLESENIALYYTITYHANGGTGSIPVQYVAIANPNAILSDGSGFSKDGFRLIGWNSDTSIADVEFAKEANIIVEDNIDLFAVWIQTFTVTFVDYDGTVLKVQTVDYGEGATQPINPTRPNYTFTGWDKAFDVVTSDLTVTALYTIATFNVTFVDYDGTVLKVQTVDYGSGATAPVNPTRTGYTFTGWDSAFDVVTSDLTVTALYRINTYTVTFVDENGEVVSPPINVDHGGNITLPNTPVPGYQVVWNHDGNNITGDLVLVRTLVPNTHYIVFNANGGSGSMVNQEIDFNQTSPLNLNTFVRSGYTFLGWATSTSGNVVYANGSNFTLTVDSDVTLYAVWQASLGQLEVPPNGNVSGSEDDNGDAGNNGDNGDTTNNGGNNQSSNNNIPQTGMDNVILVVTVLLLLSGLLVVRKRISIK